ncbi:MAG: hypothetical protein R3D33_18550 [Hyphomicrobiaceae bacterium]
MTPPPVGRTLAYMAARLLPRAGTVLTADEAHQDYVAWCGKEKTTPLKAGAFREELVHLAMAAGIALSRDTGDTVLLDTALVKPRP